MAKFGLGQVVVTNGVNTMIREDDNFSKFVTLSLYKHSNGDWGVLCEEDKSLNDEALINGDDRIFSKYQYDNDTSIYIITEYDRSATTILFPSEY